MFIGRVGRPALGVVQQAAMSSLSPAAKEAVCAWEVGEARAFREIPQPPR